MADFIFHNGQILDPSAAARSAADGFALAILGGKILAIGAAADVFRLRQKHTQLVDLQGFTLLPGFIDCHIHVWKVGNLMTHLLDLRGVESLEKLLEKLAGFSEKKAENSWISARGFNEIGWTKREIPTRNDLDQISPNRPMIVQRTCAHISVANSKALIISGLTAETPNPSGGIIDRDAAGNPTGILRETAQGLVFGKMPAYSEADYRQMIRAAEDALFAVGITTATDPAVHPELFGIYKKMNAAGELRVRIRAFPICLPDGSDVPLPLPSLINTPFLKADTIKFFSDGGLSGKTAALSRPYFSEKNDAEMGILRLKNPQFLDLAQAAILKGWKISTHAIGDRAIDFVLKTYQKLQKTSKKPLQNRIEHLGLPTEKHLDLIKKLDIGIATQPIFLEALGPNFIGYLDRDFLEKTYPVRSLLNRKIKVGFSSDAPVVRDFNPLRGIACAVHRATPSGEKIAENESISTLEGLRLFTEGAATLNGDDANLGSLEVGKWADFVVLAKNPLDVSIENLSKIDVISTWVNGKMVFGKLF
jgi:predicted amidohydrolase YtcJ